MSFASASITSH